METRVIEGLQDTQAKRYLSELVGDYRLAQALPLPFWLDPAYAYQKPRKRGPTEHALRLEAALDQMEKKRDSGDLPSQFDSLYGENPLADDWPVRARVPDVLPFAKWAERWLGPIFEHLSEVQTDEATADYEAGP